MLNLNWFRNIKDRDLRGQGVMLGEGSFVVRRMLAAGCELLGVLCTPDTAEEYRRLAAGRCPVLPLGKQEQSELVGYRFHRGVIAAARRPPRETAALLTREACRHLVILPRVQEAENLGSVIRSVVALGLNTLCLGPGCSDPYSRKAIRCSMGNVFRLALYFWEEDAAFRARLERAGFSLVGPAWRPAPGRWPVSASPGKPPWSWATKPPACPPPGWRAAGSW